MMAQKELISCGRGDLPYSPFTHFPLQILIYRCVSTLFVVGTGVLDGPFYAIV